WRIQYHFDGYLGDAKLRVGVQQGVLAILDCDESGLFLGDAVFMHILPRLDGDRRGGATREVATEDRIVDRRQAKLNRRLGELVAGYCENRIEHAGGTVIERSNAGRSANRPSRVNS